jgi:hypothetical protein
MARRPSVTIEFRYARINGRNTAITASIAVRGGRPKDTPMASARSGYVCFGLGMLNDHPLSRSDLDAGKNSLLAAPVHEL